MTGVHRRAEFFDCRTMCQKNQNTHTYQTDNGEFASMSKKPNKSAQYKVANEKFLEQKTLEEGVKALESGILMKQLEKGSGDKFPQLSSIVFVNYTGRLIDGTVFDTTDGQPLPACFRVRDLIIGWQAALLKMHAGDKYEIFIPAKYGYGSMKLDGIPAWSTLCFELELVKIQ